jgi:apolipoprotein N-acyltransferase
VIRAVNMGISAFIDPDGRVSALPGDSWERSKRMEGVVSDRVKLDRRESLYAMTGDWLPAGCWGLLVAAHFANVIWRRVSSSHRSSTNPRDKAADA